MTDARVTQTPATAAYEADATARVTQVVALAPWSFAPDARVTQAVVLAAHEFPAVSRVTQVVSLALYSSQPCVTGRAQCWRITRGHPSTPQVVTQVGQISRTEVAQRVKHGGKAVQQSPHTCG